MDSRQRSQPTASHPDAGARWRPPYPLNSDTIGLWLRRGDRLGRALLRISGAIAVLLGRWRRQVAGDGPTCPPHEAA